MGIARAQRGLYPVGIRFMKKIIIVNNNMNIGGVQKSLYNLLWALDGRYDVTLLLFNAQGDYNLPPSVKVEQCKSLFRFFGISQGACKGLDRIKRGLLRLVCRYFGRPTAVRLMRLSQRTLPQEYDCAIAYLQNGNVHNLYGGVQDFVLHCVKAKKKITLLHCDYSLSGANEARNNRLYAQFDAVAACSDGCRRVFCQTLPQYADKCVTLRNCHRFDEIRALSQDEPMEYPSSCCNVLLVTRIAHEKGVERAIEAARYALAQGIDLRLHIVGGGAMEQQMHEMVQKLGLQEKIIFYGEQKNPYRFMRNAQLLLMTSFYEAAPMVIEEAAVLSLPVLTTQTTSSEEMVNQKKNGWVCENSQEGINAALAALLAQPQLLAQKKSELQSRTEDNCAALKQFEELTEG